jgi:hypothetical protein
MTDPANCGTCNHACGSGYFCMHGACTSSCPSNLTTCGSSCGDTMTDPANCGACGHACATGEICVAGQCACPPTLATCGSSCVDTMTDPTNCGTCGRTCGAGNFCTAGQCEPCPSNLTSCGSTCVDTRVDPANCGTCGYRCPTGQVCRAGACTLTCAAGEILCPDVGSEIGVAQICVDHSIDSHNCGVCGYVCPSFQLCSASACRYPTSCTDLKANFGSSVDGSFVIQPPGRKPFTVYCAGLATAMPKEYLTLVFTNGNGYSTSNYSGFYCQPCAADARNYFEKVRIDPATLLVDVSDTTFATWSATIPPDMNCWANTTGACASVRNEAFAHAGNCIPSGVATPGNVDLRGTPFSIDPSVTTALDGQSPYGTTTFSTDRTVMDITGGGNCGDNGPTNNVFLLEQD